MSKKKLVYSYGMDTRKNTQEKKIKEYSLGEEIASSVSHGIGAGLSIAAIPILVVLAVKHGGGLHLVAALVFSLSLFLEYLMSTLYHAIAIVKAKRVFKVLDHCGIYLLIAGTYTPYCLITLLPYHGLPLFFTVWALALVGIALEAFWAYRPRWVSAVIYVVLGWCVVWYIPTLFHALPSGGFWLLVAGGISYTIGAVFYILKKVRYMHFVFHLFVLAASVCQFLSIALFAI